MNNPYSAQCDLIRSNTVFAIVLVLLCECMSIGVLLKEHPSEKFVTVEIAIIWKK